MIVVLGDIHFRDDKDYFVKTGEEFLKWFKSWDKNKSSNSLILLGDLVESTLLSGCVVDFLERFIKYSKFKNTYICVGNHDKKRYHDENQLAYEFYKNKSNIHIYENPEVVDIEDLKVLFLPYYSGVNSLGRTMKDYYSEIFSDNNFKGPFDLTVGHFCGSEFSFNGSTDCIDNIDKINTKKLILGHIHTRFISKDTYLGSVFAGKKSENDYSRSALIFDGKVWFEERLPLFNEFITVTYPDDLPISTSLVPIYTILNCGSEGLAKSKYGNIFIKRTTIDKIDFNGDNSFNIGSQFESVRELDTKILFEEFIKSQEIPIEKDIEEDCKKRLKIY